MDLWIRSQDREMLRINPEPEIYEYGNRSFLILDAKGCTDYNASLKKILGEYKTKERAIEVLDEIQNHLINNAFSKKTNGLGETLDLIPNPVFVYGMPDE